RRGRVREGGTGGGRGEWDGGRDPSDRAASHGAESTPIRGALSIETSLGGAARSVNRASGIPSRPPLCTEVVVERLRIAGHAARRLHRDEPGPYQVGEAALELDHPVLAPGLHRRQDLRGLALPDQVGDAEVDAEETPCPHADDSRS